MSFLLVTPPTDYPVTTEEARATCRLEAGDTNNDTVLTMLIAAATSFVEEYLGRAIMPQTWALYQDSFPDAFMLSRGPVTSVTSIAYYDTDSVLQTVDAANYSADLVSDPAWVVPVSTYSWPDTADGVNNVILTYEAGYAVVPDPIKWAILLLISQWFDNRADVSDKPMTEIPNGIGALLANYRAFGF